MIKRLFDLFFSLIGVIILSPLLLVLAILIKTSSPGPVFYRGIRAGKNGKNFKIFKFRTMVVNAEKMSGPSTALDDPRLTRIGKFLRKWKLDELPQLFNVIKGDMSLVGPRAYYPDELREQQKKYPTTRDSVKVVLSVKPGLTGYWQVSGRSEINFDKRIEMDAQYVRKRSILYDLWIILKTPWAMISGKGAL